MCCPNAILKKFAIYCLLLTGTCIVYASRLPVTFQMNEYTFCDTLQQHRGQHVLK